MAELNNTQGLKAQWQNGQWKQGLGAAAASLGSSIPTGDPRGFWDTMDPVYHLAQGRESKAGNAMSDAGVSLTQSGLSSGNPFLMLAGAGLKIFGGLANAAFGVKTDEEQLAAVNQGVEANRNFQSNASSFDDIQNLGATANASDIYQGGWFSKGKARRKNEKLMNESTQTRDFAQGQINANISELQDMQTTNALANYMALGGALHTNGADWTNGITLVDNGNSHESNPLGGVPMGIAPDGQPNLVEEGEVIFNDYVFSNRLKVPNAVRNKYKLRGTKDMTFADAAKKAQKESEERPNDPISKRGLEDIMNKLMQEQELIKAKKEERQIKADAKEANEILGSVFAEGGNIHIKPSKKGTFTAAATKHNMSVSEFANEVLSNPDKYTPLMRKKANFAKNASGWKHALGGHLFDGTGDSFMSRINPLADISYSPKVWDNSWDTKLMGVKSKDLTIPDYNLKPTLLTSYPPLRDRNPELEEGLTKTSFEPMYLQPEPITMTPVKINLNDAEHQAVRNLNTKNRDLGLYKGLRYAPVLGSAIGLMQSVLKKPDYSRANDYLRAARNIRDIKADTLGDYMAYKPMDVNFAANQERQQSNSTARALTNLSGGNRGAATASLLANNYNLNTNLGKLYRQAEEYNLAQRKDVSAFNRETNRFNAEQKLKADLANTANDLQRAEAWYKAGAWKDTIDDARTKAIQSNLTTLFDNLGNVGIDIYNRKDRDMLLNAGVYGTLSQKPQEWSQERWNNYRSALLGIGYKNGGKLKKKKGLTI